MNIPRIALVGVQGFARSHLRSLDTCEKEGLCCLEALVIRPADLALDDPARSSFQDRGIRIHDSFAQLIQAEQGQIDAICIPCSIHEHAPMSMTALEAGYHVLCEKPAAGTLEEALAMKVSQEKSGRILAIGFQNIHAPSIQRLKALALSGRLGKLVEARSYAIWPRTSAYYSRNSWAGKDVFQGRTIHDSPIQNGVAHYLQNLLYVAGPSLHESASPTRILAENYRVKDIEGADTQVFRILTREHVSLFFAATHAARESEGPLASFHFEDGSASWQDNGDTVVYDAQGKELERFGNDGADMHTQVFRDFCAALNGSSPTPSTIANAWQHTWCVDKSFESSRGIQAIPRALVEEIEGAYDPYTGRADSTNINQVLPNMEELIRQAYEERCGFWDLGLPWAVEPQELRE